MRFEITMLGLVLLVWAGVARDARARQPATVTEPAPAASEAIVVAAGDISCDPASPKFKQGRGTAKHCHMLATSELAASLKPSAVLILGDSQYENGSLDAYQKSWGNNWGRKELRDITHPAVGNHEYNTPDASGYFDYFGKQAGERGKGYYSFTLGSWHIVALNTGSNDYCKPLSCAEGSEQEKWLREDLRQSASACTMAFWHRPLFTSGLHRGAVEVTPFWRDLYEARADVILNGHSHQYERFAPQNPEGKADPDRGIVQFVVGTGGKNLKGFWRNKRNSVMRNSRYYGVLKLQLGSQGYAWQFITEDGQVLDRGEGQCHAKLQPVKAQ